MAGAEEPLPGSPVYLRVERKPKEAIDREKHTKKGTIWESGNRPATVPTVPCWGGEKQRMKNSAWILVHTGVDQAEASTALKPSSKGSYPQFCWTTKQNESYFDADPTPASRKQARLGLLDFPRRPIQCQRPILDREGPLVACRPQGHAAGSFPAADQERATAFRHADRRVLRRMVNMLDFPWPSWPGRGIGPAAI